jgi:hypothetical protein
MRCRNACLRDGKLYYVVSIFFFSDKVTNMAENSITRNRYRYGWHFPHEFVIEALVEYGLDSPDEINTLCNLLVS